MDRAELEKIGRDTADKIMSRYKTRSIEHALAESIGEEHAAVETYLMRISEAVRQGDSDTAKVYDEIRRDEQDHLEKLNGRLIQKGGPIIFQPESNGGWVIYRDKLGDIHFSHTGGSDNVLSSAQDEDSVWNILTPEERNNLDHRNILTISDSESRSKILAEIQDNTRGLSQIPDEDLLAFHEHMQLRPHKSLSYGELRVYANEFIDNLKFMGGIPKDKEAATILYRKADGEIDMAATRIGDVGTVNFPAPPFGAKIIATIHTHPSGDLEFSPMDYVVAWNNNLEGQCVITPDGKRCCELLNFDLLSKSDKEAAGQAIMSGLSPHVEDREGKYRKVGEILKKAVVSRQ